MNSQSLDSATRVDNNSYASLIHVARVMWRSWLFIAGFVALLTTLAALLAFSLTPLYTANTTLLLEPEQDNVTNVSALFSESDFSFVYFETQRNLIASKEVLRKVANRLALVDQPLFSPPLEKPWWQVNWRSLLPMYKVPEQPLTEDEIEQRREDYALAKLKNAVSVLPVPRTELLVISVKLADPALAALVANELAAVYVESGLEAHFDKAKQANQWVGGRVQQLKRQLEASELALQDYLDRNKLTDVGGIRGLVEADIQQNTANLLAAKKTVAVLKNVVAKINRAGGRLDALEGVQRLVSDRVVQDARRDLQAAQRRVKSLSTRYGAKHPKLIEALSAVDEARAIYHEQLKLVAENVLTEYQLAKQSVADIEKFTSDNKQQLTQLGKQSFELRTLQRNVDLNRQLYDLFLGKMKETDISGQFDTVNARVIDAAVAPRSASEPQKLKIIAIAFVLSLFVAMGLVLLRFLLDNKITTPEQYSQIIEPSVVLASVPSHGKVNWKKGRAVVEDVLLKNRAFNEAMRTLRTNIQLSEVDAKKQVLMLGSAVPEEGKTTISIGLAHAFSQLGSVLLVEADLRKPSLAKRLSVEAERHGLVDYLLGKVDLEDAIESIDSLGISVMSVSAAPANPQELLQSKKFADMVTLLKQKYDRIIFDTAPILAVADAQVLAPLVDGVMLVSRAEQTHLNNIRHAAERFSALPDSHFMGGILNGIDAAKLARYYGKQYKQYYDYYG